MVWYAYAINRTIAQRKERIMPATTITTADLATQFETTPRTLRKFLRAQDAGVGKGQRYSLPAGKREVTALQRKFEAWTAAQAKAAPEAAPEA